MATNGIVSITQGGRTLIKVVTGQNGFMADGLAACIVAEHLTDVDAVWDAALAWGIGDDSLVVQGRDRARHLDDYDLARAPLYAEKFDDPRFNPRWESGTAEYVVVIDADTWSVWRQEDGQG